MGGTAKRQTKWIGPEDKGKCGGFEELKYDLSNKYREGCRSYR